MKNYVAKGETVTLVAPAAVLAGTVVKVGSILGVAAGAADIGAAVECVTCGVFDLAKVSAQAWATVGRPIYWDAGAALVTTTGAGNTLIGVNLATAVNPSATGRVRLNGSFT
jgi:predicted RecA/RadA family phage recombinase